MRFIFVVFLFTILALQSSAQDKINVKNPKIGQIAHIHRAYVLDGIYDTLPNDNFDSIASIITTLQNYKFEVACHTDCRGPILYNDSFSQAKADNIRKYIIEKGAPPGRVVAKGYGERQLLNNCNCEDGKGHGLDCNEEEHQKNRRIELKIIGKNKQ